MNPKGLRLADVRPSVEEIMNQNLWNIQKVDNQSFGNTINIEDH
jgi:hypothetical protein